MFSTARLNTTLSIGMFCNYAMIVDLSTPALVLKNTKNSNLRVLNRMIYEKLFDVETRTTVAQCFDVFPSFWKQQLSVSWSDPLQ